MIHTVLLDRVPAQAWRNGGGSTQELLAWPLASQTAAWHWRISVASIARSGPFSAYPGVQRWFTVLTGDGVRLRFDGSPAGAPATALLLTPDHEPLAFEGGAAPDCELLGGPTLDLNLMLHRAQGQMLRVQAEDEWRSAAACRAVFTMQPCVLQIDDTDAAHLPASCLAWSDHAQRQRWRLQGLAAPAQAWWLSCQVTP